MATIASLEARYSANIIQFDRELKRLQTLNKRATDKVLADHKASARDVNNAWAKADIGGAMNRSLGNGLGQLRTQLMASIAAITSGAGIAAAVGLADTYTRFQNSLKVAGLAGSELASVQNSLFEIANRNGQAVEGLGQLYGRMAMATRQLGATQSDLLQVTNAVASAIKISGRPASEAAGAMTQLSQAFAGGKVRAEEWNSVVENMPWVSITDPRIATSATAVTTINAKIGNVSGTVADALAGKASASDLSDLSSTVSGQGTTISSQGGRLTTVETDLAGKASTSSVTTLNNEIVAGRNGAASLKARIDGLQTTLTDAINLKASTSQVNSIESTLNLKPQTYAQTSAPSTSGRIIGDLWMDTDDNNQLYRWSGSAWVNAGDLRGETALAEITAARGGQANLNARFTQVNTTITDGLAGKASAQSVSDLSVTVGGHTSTISSVQSVATEANNRSKAIVGLTSTVGGLVTGFSSVNNGSQTAFRVQADKFELVPSGTGARTEFSAGAWKIYDSSNRKRIHLGLG